MAKVLVSIDDRLLRRIDRAAESARLSRSAYLSGLAEREFLGGEGPGGAPAALAAMRKLDRLFKSAPAGDSTAAIRAERDAR
ncbi:MAG TPA: hypothetical protein VMS60_00425 [Solirubrobacterales bacterium]|nr:hypothetical protein [Solirubrobacterales bacterium]